MQKLPREFYNRKTIEVAQDLLGKHLIYHHNGIDKIGRIVEVEAYIGEHDLACHSSKGLTNRTRIMFGPAGYAYIYMIYGLYYCLNVVTEEEGHGSAILIRALEPVQNIEGRTQGPGLLCKALDLNKTQNGTDLLGSNLYLTDPLIPEKFSIIKTTRIGVAYAKEWANKLLRFYIKDNLYVSRR